MPTAWNAHVKSYMATHNIAKFAVAAKQAKASYTPKPKAKRTYVPMTEAQKAAKKIASLKKKHNLICTRG